MNCDNASLLLYAVTDRSWLHGQTLYAQAEQALQGGATFLQLREKELDEAHFQEEAIALKALCKQYGVPFVLDDNVALAVATDADGVHVGQSDIPVEVCRKLLGPDAIVGLSARCEEMLEYVKTADMSLVDYLGIGPLHETETKRDCGRAADGSIITKSFEDLAALHAASPVPIVVGGGVKTADLPQLKATGVDGFFVVSAVCSADDPHAAAKELVDTWQQA